MTRGKLNSWLASDRHFLRGAGWPRLRAGLGFYAPARAGAGALRLLTAGLVAQWLWPCAASAVLPHGPNAAQAAQKSVAAPAYKEGELLVGLRDFNEAKIRPAALERSGLQVIRSYKIAPILHLRIKDGGDLQAKIAALKATGKYTFVEPNYRLTLCDTTPNDPRFGDQWGLHNTGANFPGGGVAGADVSAPRAWDISTGDSNIIVAVIDTGIDYTHEDLKANMWVNPGEIAGNGQDDDGDGYVDDVYGYDFADHRPDPMPDPAATAGAKTGHGTHCAGIIGAVGSNGVDICGVNWNVRLMALKISDTNGVISIAAAIEAIDYAWKHGVRVVNASWGGYVYSEALQSVIQTAGLHGMLFCASAGNEANNNDITPAYPSSYGLDSIISVAATDNRDRLANFSNYGATTVDLAAPGVQILSTLPGNTLEAWDGTSMATPFVAGAAALLLSVHSNMSPAELKAEILDSVDLTPALVGKTVTGGRLNLFRLLSSKTNYLVQSDVYQWSEPPVAATRLTGADLNATVCAIPPAVNLVYYNIN
jgi:subtilisin family serine protease